MVCKDYITFYQGKDKKPHYYYKGVEITSIIKTLEKKLDDYFLKSPFLNRTDFDIIPYRIGANAYRVWDECTGENCPFNGGWGNWRCKNESHKDYCEPFIEEIEFSYEDIKDLGETVFTNKKEAEKKLKKLIKNDQE